jgi:hypothetical protein
MPDPRDYKLDLTSMPKSQSKSSSAARPFLSAYFTCCNVYLRIYRNQDGAHYDGACPRCGKRVRFTVGPGGTTSRAFVIE